MELTEEPAAREVPGDRLDIHPPDHLAQYVPAVREYQLSPRPRELGVRVVLQEGTQVLQVLESLRRMIRVELDAAGAIVDDVTVEVVDAIERTGTGAKQKPVSAWVPSSYS